MRWGMRHAGELAQSGEGNDVWMITYDGEDVADVYGAGFARCCVDDLNEEEDNEVS